MEFWLRLLESGGKRIVWKVAVKFCKHKRDENDESEECSVKELPLLKEDTPSSRQPLTTS